MSQVMSEVEAIKQKLSELADEFPEFLNVRCYSMRDIDTPKYAHIPERARENRFLKFWREYMLTSDDVPTLVDVYREVLTGAYPAQIWRRMARWIQAREPTVRIPKMPMVTAFYDSKGGRPPEVSEPPSWIDINTDLDGDGRRVRARKLFDVSALTASAINLVREYTQEIGRAIMLKVQEYIVGVYDGVANTDLAGGSEVALTGPLTFSKVLDVKSQLDAENMNVDGGDYRCFLHPTRWNELLKDTAFVDSMIWGTSLEKTTGEQGRSTAGIRFHVSSSIPSNKLYMINPDRAVYGIIVESLVVEPIEPDITTSGIDAYIHIAAKAVDTKALARASIA